MLPRPRKAFTLIELLVVVAIISLLIAMLLPSLNNARSTSRMVICMSHQRQYLTANVMYASDWNDVHVPIKTKQGEGAEGRTYDMWMHNKQYQALLGRDQALNEYAEGGGFLQCPDLTSRPTRPGGFAGTYGMVWSWITGPAGFTQKQLIVSRTRVRYPASAVMMADSTDWNIIEDYADYTTKWDIYGERNLWQIAYRHQEGIGVNVVHFDGSAEYLSRSDAWDEPAVRRRLWSIYEP